MKKIFLKFFYSFTLLCVYSFIVAQPISAAGEFYADYETQYSVSLEGTTIVTQKVRLTNRLSNYYPQKYAITLDSTKIKNIIAYDEGGSIQPEITVSGGKTEIILNFNKKAVGQGKQSEFTLRYQHGDVAARQGQIWEVNIPGIKDDPDIRNYEVLLEVPPSFGPNAYLSPSPNSSRRWSREQMVKGGISAAYGSKQVFDLNLSYFLENTTGVRKRDEIALPPDTATQKVTIREITPRPNLVSRDADGNWIASYNLNPGEKLDISTKLAVAVYLKPQDAEEKPFDTSPYLRPDKYWETDNPQIKALAQQYRTPREIYDFVVKTLTYDYERATASVERKGAVAALAQPETAVCMEFTDLFIAIARAAGIPAREVVGYAHTTNPRLRPLSLVADVLHAWPQYFDLGTKQWVSVDPTWANTTGGVNYFDKLDFNHLVFAIHGSSSQYPPPAGFYRRQGKSGKDILVGFAQALPPPASATTSVRFNFPAKAMAGWPISGEVVVENLGSQSITDLTVSVTTSPFSTQFNQTGVFLPPLGSLTIPLTFPQVGYFESQTVQIIASVNDQTYNYTFSIVPNYWIILIFAAALSVLLIVAIFILKRPWKPLLKK